MPVTYTLRFYTTDEQHRIRPLAEEPEPSLWHDIAHHLGRLAQRTERLTSEATTAAESIDILLVDLSDLRARAFYDGLASRCFRTSLAASSPSTTEPGTNMRPVITVGVFDVMPIYEEAFDLELGGEMHHLRSWQQQRQDNALLYSLHLDHRVKFLDSSIWHRYLPLTDGFAEHFPSLLRKIIGYCDQRLYQSLSGLATLEFQCRLLKNSHIAKYGDRGHYEAVTPFKFHSETMMERKAERFLHFFSQERENGSRLTDLQWRVLMVDDYAAKAISTVEGEQGQPSKLDIISGLVQRRTPDGHALQLRLDHCTKTDDNVINEAIDLMQDNGFDLVFLDYLLGSSQPLTDNYLGHWAYGHELLLEMMTGPQTDAIKSGPFGRHWIFPISSFPFAFSDKLEQLNIHTNTEYWYIAHGADPIATPERFYVNLCQLLLRQIERIYLHQAAIVRTINRFAHLRKQGHLVRAIKKQIESFDLRSRASFAEDPTPSRTSLIASLKSFLTKQEDYREFVKEVDLWLDKLERHEANGDTHYLVQEAHTIREKYKAHKYGNELFYFIEVLRRNGTLHDVGADLLQMAKQLSAESNSQLNFQWKWLQRIPEQLPEVHPSITSLDLSHNELHRVGPVLGRLRCLEHLDLSHNQLLDYLDVSVFDLPELRSVDLSHTLLGNHISHSSSCFANSRRALQNMKKRIDEFQQRSQTTPSAST